MKKRKRLLFVSPRFLFPMDEGGKIRSSNILRSMKGGTFELTLASPAPPDRIRFDGEITDVCDRFLHWPARRRSTPERFMALGLGLPVSVAADRSAAGCAMITKAIALEKPDVLVVDFPHAAVLVKHIKSAASVMFTHNVEAEIYERHAALARGMRAPVWRDQARKMKRYEGEALRRFDAVIAVSARDAYALRNRYSLPVVEQIDTGVDLEFFQMTPIRKQADTLVFVGVLDSAANADAVRFLMDEIWPLIIASRPDAKALIVGRNPAPALVAAAKERSLPWIFTGKVDDIRAHVALGDVSVIPMRAGSGTRIKAFEAMAMGRPVVSTHLGVEGLDLTPVKHFIAADTAAEFARAVLQLLENAALRENLVRAARAHLEANSTWSAVARQFETICESAVQRYAGAA